MSSAHFRRATPAWLLIVGVMVAALSLRGPIVAPTPVLSSITDDFGIGSSTAGLVSSVPVLLFATMTPVAVVMIRRAGPDAALVTFLLGILAGTLMRSLPGFGWLMAGTALIGVSITVGNVVVPVLIRREVSPARVPLVTAVYGAALNAGSLLTSLLTAPVADIVGWPLALLAWSLITCAGLAVCGYALSTRRRIGLEAEPDDTTTPNTPSDGGAEPVIVATADADPGPRAETDGSTRAALRSPVVLLLALAFGLQTAIYWGLSTWLPTITADELGMTRSGAGAMSSIYQGFGILGALAVPVLIRYTPRIVPALTVGLAGVVLAVGILVHPGYFPLWLAFGALSHAGGFVVIFATLVAISRSDRETATRAAVVQAIGYAVASIAGPALGVVHEWSGGWEIPLGTILAVAVSYCFVLCVSVAVASRNARER